MTEILRRFLQRVNTVLPVKWSKRVLLFQTNTSQMSSLFFLDGFFVAIEAFKAFWRSRIFKVAHKNKPLTVIEIKVFLKCSFLIHFLLQIILEIFFFKVVRILFKSII